MQVESESGRSSSFRLLLSAHAWLVLSIELAIMSALQTFMLVVDHDKEEAKRIADLVAQGKSNAPRTRPPGPPMTMTL